MENCKLDYRSCGHCKVRFDGPFGHEARPSCDKASFFKMLFGDDWCPNAPMVEDDDMKIYSKYKIEHTDGTPLKGKKYFVLRLDSDDPMEAARVARAMRAYEGKLRNCDVGVAEEQIQRWKSFCKGYKRCEDCPIKGESPGMVRCAIEWENMPYNEEER